MRILLTLLFSLFSVLLSTTALTAEKFVWIESEHPTARHGIKELTTWGQRFTSMGNSAGSIKIRLRNLALTFQKP